MTERINNKSLLQDTALGVSGEIADAVHGLMGYDDSFMVTEEGNVSYEDKRSENPLTPKSYGAILHSISDYTEKLALLGADDAKIRLGETGVRVSILKAVEGEEATWQVFETPYEDESLPQVAS